MRFGTGCIGLLVLCDLWFGITTVARAGQRFPFTAHVIADRVHVRSGPGGDFYPTSELSRGDEVEVYWQNAQGWYAVRPPAGSFSWLPAESLNATDQKDVAKVVQAQVPAQIGSQLSDERNVAQVELDAGELVEVLDIVTFEDERWFKIAPPPGEFRWIRGGDIDRRPLEAGDAETQVVLVEPVPLDNETLPAGNTNITDSSPQPAAEPTEISNQLVSWTSRQDTGAEEEKESVTKSSKSQPRWRKPTAGGEPTPATERSQPEERHLTLDSPPDASPVPKTLHSNTTLLELDVALSRMVAGPKSTWRLEPLRVHARTLAFSAATEAERAGARALLERIADFEEIRLRAENLGIEPLTPERSATRRGDLAATTSGYEAGAADPNYDGSGWLMPVVTRRRDVPQYALTDDYGRILKFVTPTPGLNLRRYLRKQIAVRGTQRSVPQLYRPHIMAERVMELDRRRR